MFNTVQKVSARAYHIDTAEHNKVYLEKLSKYVHEHLSLF